MDDTIQNLIIDALEAFDKRIAVEQGSRSFTYSDVKHKAFIICNYLLENADQEYVAVSCDDRFITICSMVGILLAKKIFVLVEKRLPIIKKQRMLDLINCKYVITDTICALADDLKYQYIYINEIQQLEENDCVLSEYSREDSVYVFYTSGTTGEPKAVVGKNKSLVHFILWEIETFQINADSCFAQFTSISHDPFLRDILVPLLVGGKICIPEDEYVIFDSKNIVDFLNQHQISHIHCTPSIFKTINFCPYTPSDFISLRYIFFAGEELKAYIFKEFYNMYQNRVTFVNFYGPTETTMAKMYHIITENDMNNEPIPIGKPITNTIVHIKKNEYEQCDSEEEGEIYISSEYSSWGYTDQEYTKLKFVTLDNITYYQTGDIGKKRADGLIIFCGRKDNQIKIRGNRVETCEIEHAFLEITQVKDVIVLPKLNQKTKEYYFCAYYIWNQELNSMDIKMSLSEVLPDYMIPSKIFRVLRFPININGKVDLKELEKNTLSRIDSHDEKSNITNNTESLIKRIWDELLGDEETYYTIDDDLFLIGIDSLKVFEFINNLEEQCNLEIAAGDVFKLRSIRAISAKVRPINFLNSECNQIDNIEKVYDILPIQKQIYEIDFRFKNIKFLNWSMLKIYNMKKQIGLNDLQNHINYIVNRHEILCSYFEVVDHTLKRKTENNLNLEIQYYDSNCKDEEIVSYSKSLAKSFNLNNTPLIEVFVVSNGLNRYLCLNIHHIISDDKTFDLLIDEISMLCNNMKLPNHVKQYQEFVNSRNLYANKDLAYWLDKIKKTGKIILPNCKSTCSFEASVLKVTVNAKFLNNNIGLTRYMVCAASIILLLYIETRKQYVSVLSFHDLRTTYKHINTMGLFTHNVILFNKISNTTTIDNFLDSVRNSVLETYEFKDYYYEDLIDNMKQSGVYEHNVLLNYQKNVSSNLTDSVFGKVNYEEKTCNLDMIFEIIENTDLINISLKYKRKMYTDDYMKYFSALFSKIINSLTSNSTLSIEDYISKLKKYR